MKINFKKLIDSAITPKYQTQYSAGADLTSIDNYEINPNETKFISTGIAVEIPEGFGGFIFARSGLATKKGLAPANKVGVIDSDYRGEIIVALFNQSCEKQIILKGDRVAQLVIIPIIQADFIESDYLSDSVRGKGGFGSTGK